MGILCPVDVFRLICDTITCWERQEAVEVMETLFVIGVSAPVTKRRKTGNSMCACHCAPGFGHRSLTK